MTITAPAIARIPVAVPTVSLPDLTELPERLQAKLRAMDPRQLHDIFNPKEGQQ